METITYIMRLLWPRYRIYAAHGQKNVFYTTIKIFTEDREKISSTIYFRNSTAKSLKDNIQIPIIGHKF
jgi:hypothetical protein